MSLAAASTAASGLSTNLIGASTSGLTIWVGVPSGQQRFEVVGDHLRLPRLSVPRGPADVRRQHHVGHADQRMVDRQPFAVEVVQARRGHLAAAQRVDERVGVVQLGAGGVEEDHAVAHGRELLGADHARRCRR